MKNIHRHSLPSRVDSFTKNFLYRLLFKLFKRKPGLDKHYLLAELKLEIRNSLIRDNSRKLIAADSISIQVSNEIANKTSNIEDIALFLSKEIAKYIQNCHFNVPIVPRVRIVPLSSIKDTDYKIKCYHTPSDFLPTQLEVIRLQFTWEGGSKEIKLPAGSFFVGTTNDCEQRINVSGFSGKLAYIESAENAVKVALISDKLDATCEGVQMERKRKYLLRPGTQINFNHIIKMRIFQS